MRTLPIAVTLALLLAAGAGVAAQHDSRAFLAATFALTNGELTKLDSGHVVARTLGTGHSREVATLGIVRMQTTPEAYIERLRDIVAFKRTENILEIGRFSDPPAVADMAALTVEASDLHELRDCRVAACGVRLSAEGIERIQREVDWRHTGAPRRAGDLLKELLVDYVAQYQRAAPPAMMVYADRETPFDLATEFAAMAEAESATWRQAPALRRHLLQPRFDQGGVTDFVYWSKERVHRRAVVSLTHVAIAATGADSPIDYVAASKQIYATHYFDASLGLTLLLRDRRATTPATYVVYLNRTRIDLFDGLLGGIARKVVAGKARTLVAEQMARLQRSMRTPAPASID